MKIYVAGNFAKDRPRCRSIAVELVKFKHQITFEWYDVEPKDFGPHNAFLDIAGVRDADVLVVLMDKDRKFGGTWCEVGMAIILDIPIYFIGDVNAGRVVFMSHPLVRSLRFDWPMPNEVEQIYEASKRSIGLDRSGYYKAVHLNNDNLERIP